jgi:predicted NBD/HSP70 family sugar kinase
VMIDRDLEAGAIAGGKLVNAGTAPAIGWDGIGDLARLTEFAHDGDRDAAEALWELGEKIGRTMAAFVQLYQPQVLVLSGSAVAAGELLLGPVRSGLAAAGVAPPGDEVPIVIGRFGADAGIAGAAALAFDELERRAK